MSAGDWGVRVILAASGLVLLLACHLGGTVPALAPQPLAVTAGDPALGPAVTPAGALPLAVRPTPSARQRRT